MGDLVGSGIMDGGSSESVHKEFVGCISEKVEGHIGALLKGLRLLLLYLTCSTVSQLKPET